MSNNNSSGKNGKGRKKGTQKDTDIRPGFSMSDDDDRDNPSLDQMGLEGPSIRTKGPVFLDLGDLSSEAASTSEELDDNDSTVAEAPALEREHVPEIKTPAGTAIAFSPAASNAVDDYSGAPGGHDATVLAPAMPQDDATRLSPALKKPSSPPSGRLVVIEGREKGRIVDLYDGSMVIGRADECDISLLDIQISRRHAEINVDAGTVNIKDLGSGNGTEVNRERVQNARLIDGDMIAVGDHILKYEEKVSPQSAVPAMTNYRGGRESSESALPAVPEQPIVDSPAMDVVLRSRRKRTGEEGGGGRKKKLILLGGTVLILGAVVIAIALMPEPPPPPPAGPTPEQIARESFNEGLRSFRGKSYGEALAMFEKAVEHMPEHREAQRYVVAARREIEAENALKKGNELMAEGNFAEARESFGSISEESIYREDAVAALRRVNDQELRSIILEGEQYLEDDQLDEAEERFQSALAIVDDYGPAVEGLENVEKRRDEITRMGAAQRARVLAAAKKAQREEEERRRRNIRQALAEGESLFDRGDFQGALNKFIEISQRDNPEIKQQAERKAGAIREFRPHFERGMSAAENRSADQAINSLKAAEPHARVVSPNGTIHNRVRERMADMHNIQARIAFNAKRYSVAYNHWSSALKVHERHAPSRQGMNELLRVGEELYLEAYMTRTLAPQESIRKFRQVMQMTPPDSDPHRRSRARLAELER